MKNRDFDASSEGRKKSHEWELPFEAMVEQINDGILVVKMSGEIVYANPSMASMIGYTRQEMVGAKLFDFMDPEWSARTRENLQRRREGVEEIFDHKWQHRDGTDVWTLVSAKPIGDELGDQRGSLVSVQDISERKRMEEELRQARDELETRVQERTRELRRANERLQTEVAVRTEAERQSREASRAKSVFLANMSHELRTPLTSIIGYSELIQEDLEFGHDDPESLSVEVIEKDLEKISAAGAHLLEVINNILDLTKVEVGKMTLQREPVAIEELIDEVFETVTPLAIQNDNQLIAEQDYHDEFVGDRMRLKQVLLNLVDNAVKFTRSGKIKVRTGATTVDGPQGIRIEVSDTGIGIRDDQVALLLDPFRQADESTTREYGGTGLGLTICKSLVEMMNGTIDVESVKGEGTTVIVEVPSQPTK